MDRPTQAHVAPTFYIDSDHEDVIRFAANAIGDAAAESEKAARLYLAVRDGLWYDPYDIKLRPIEMKASAVLARGLSSGRA